jgi:hypothetical protein
MEAINRYSGQQSLDAQLAGGRYLVSLRQEYLRQSESVHTLESKLQRLYEQLGFPGWLSVLCRNCRHARGTASYRLLFDREFAYLARLWAEASSREEFEARYDRRISAWHEVS